MSPGKDIQVPQGYIWAGIVCIMTTAIIGMGSMILAHENKMSVLESNVPTIWNTLEEIKIEQKEMRKDIRDILTRVKSQP